MMGMGNTRINHIKLLQKTREQNKQFRETGIKPTANQTPTPAPAPAPTPAPAPAKRGFSSVQISYIRCSNCGQQILKSTIQNHLRLCKSSVSGKKSGCSACNKFRNGK